MLWGTSQETPEAVDNRNRLTSAFGAYHNRYVNVVQDAEVQTVKHTLSGKYDGTGGGKAVEKKP